MSSFMYILAEVTRNHSGIEAKNIHMTPFVPLSVLMKIRCNELVAARLLEPSVSVG
jgi:hypothetical protein